MFDSHCDFHQNNTDAISNKTNTTSTRLPNLTPRDIYKEREKMNEFQCYQRRL